MEQPLAPLGEHHDREERHPESFLEGTEPQLLDLPVEIIVKICKFLEDEDKAKLAQTSKSMRNIVYVRELWIGRKVIINLHDDLTLFSDMYRSFHDRGIYNLQFDVTNHLTLNKHIPLLVKDWPSLSSIIERTSRRTARVEEEHANANTLELENLTTLIITTITNKFSSVIQGVKSSLRYLSVRNSSFDDTLAMALVEFKQLEALNVSRTLLTDKGIATLCGYSFPVSGDIGIYDAKASLFNLRVFNISNNLNITLKSWENLHGLPKLNILVTSVVTEPPLDVEMVSQLTKICSLHYLIVDGSNVPDSFIAEINRINLELEGLHFKSCDLRDFSMRFDQGLKKLVCLKLSSFFLTNEGIRRICSNLKQLVILDLSGCRNLTDSCFTHINNLKELKYLNITNCANITPAHLNSTHTFVIKSNFSVKSPDLNRIIDDSIVNLSFCHGFVHDNFL